MRDVERLDIILQTVRTALGCARGAGLVSANVRQMSLMKRDVAKFLLICMVLVLRSQISEDRMKLMYSKFLVLNCQIRTVIRVEMPEANILRNSMF
jgi:hypothetical protein